MTTGWRIRVRALDWGVVDAIVAMLLAGAAVAAVAASKHPGAVPLVAAAVFAATVAWRRRAPAAAIVVALVSVAAVQRAGGPELAIAPIVALLDYYTLGRRSGERGWAPVELLLLAFAIPVLTASPSNPHLVDVASVWAFFFVAPFGAGRAIGSRSALTRELRGDADRLAREQRQRALSAAADERTRIARELHDVVAHSVSVMVVQTQAARRVAGADREAARTALRSVESCGRDAWRRQAPLAVACIVTGAVVVLALALPDFNAVQSPTFVLFIPPYTVAAYEPRSRALAGLAVCLAAPCLLNALHPAGGGSWAFAVGMCGASWTTGRVLHARRTLAAELRDRAQRIAAERDGRTRLAVADERTRIARELNAVVARSVSAMVVQSETAQRLLDLDGERADAAMAALEDTGREALADMRRILGVLRRIDDQVELAPQPGVGQIPALVERARDERRHVVLHVEGEPGPLPASVDLGMYRVLHDALTGARGADAARPIEVALRFGELDVTLEVTAGGASLEWPTPAMRERVALCDGELEVDDDPHAGARLLVRMPRAFDGALS